MSKNGDKAYHFLYNFTKRIELINMLGGKCSRCSFSDWRALHVDHVNNDGHLERSDNSSNGVSALLAKVRESLKSGTNRYQLLCANCNCIKSYEFDHPASAQLADVLNKNKKC